jgi:membrane associated rhomboid family serine protease
MHIGFPRLTPVVKKLLIANIAVFLLVYLSGVINERLVDFWHLWFSVYPAAPYMYLELWRLVTYQFLHANFGHILFNMIALCVFGPMLESVWGSRKFLVFYLVCGAMGGIFYPILAWVGWLHTGILIGASGAILGCLAAAAILFPNRRLYIWGVLPVRISVLAIILAVISVATLLQPDHYPNAGGEAAHLAGMAAGAAYVLTGSWRARLGYKWKSRGRTRKLKNERNVQMELDRILEKVHDSGIHSLSSHEKKVLRDATKLQQMRDR